MREGRTCSGEASSGWVVRVVFVRWKGKGMGGGGKGEKEQGVTLEGSLDMREGGLCRLEAKTGQGSFTCLTWYSWYSRIAPLGNMGNLPCCQGVGDLESSMDRYRIS
jgi:hypothetical protein